MKLYFYQKVMIYDHHRVKLSEDAMLQPFTNAMNKIRPCKMLNDRVGNDFDPNVATLATEKGDIEFLLRREVWA